MASLAIDGDEGTYNHTACNGTDNWWQVSLPNPSVISRIVVKNRSGQLARLNQASVYISASAYSAPMDETDKIHTLNSGSVQEITLPTPLSGAYVIVKASGSNCLHMTELEVYGEVPTAPQFSGHESSYSIAQTKPINATVVTLSANDFQNNLITYSLTGNVPFAVDSLGKVTVNGALTIGDIHAFNVNASDGAETTSTSLTVTIKASTAPAFLGGEGHYSIAENAALNTSVGFVKATDIDLDSLTYSLKEAGTPFQIDSLTGEITVSGAIDRGAGIQQTITVAVTDQASSVEQKQTIFIIPAANANTTGIYLEHWTGISGNTVTGLTSNSSYPDDPAQTSVLTSFEAPSQDYGSYGQRASGYLKVSESAEYTFWVASDDESQLRLSSDTDPVNMGDPIVSVDGWTSSQQWTKYESQKSAPINLVAGRLYYIEALHKEGGGGDHVAVAIQKAGDASLTLINGSQVIPPYVIDGIAPTAPTSLGSDSVSAGSVEIVWSASNDSIGIASYQIYRDDLLIATVASNVFNYIDNNVSSDTTHNYQVIAFDAFGNESIAATLAVDTATSVDSVATALQTGDARHVLNDTNLVVAALAEINSLRSKPNLLADLYQTDPIVYTQAQSSQIINLVPSDKTQPILLGNAGKTLGMAGVTETSRYAAFGQVPMQMFQDYVDNPDHPFEAPFKRLLAWLIAGEPIDITVLNINRTVAVAFASDYSSDINGWLNEHYANWDIVECNTAPDLNSCLAQADLILTGSRGDIADAGAIQQALSAAMADGKPVVYMHNRGWGANDVSHNIASLLGFTLPYGGNYWAKDGANWDNVSLMYEQVFSALGLESIETMLTHFRDQDYNFDWSVCKDGDKLGEQYDDCGDVVGLSDFVSSASAVRSIVSGLESAKTDIFTANGYRLEKLLVLIADKFRQSVTYPMDKVTTDDNKFMRSYYADNVVYNYRKLNPAQADMGNFSRSDFSHVTPITKTVNLTSKKNFRSTGAYALPGQTFKVTRNDTSDLTVKVFINTLRSGATHQYQQNAYNRPKYLQSTYFEIDSGETIELTSPYGGTLQLNFSANDLPVEITFENVGEHAYWASSVDEASFTARLDAGDFDWAEVVTSGFEVHSKLDKMRNSVADTKWGTPQALANATERYMSNFPHVLAGFKGPGIDVVDEIHDFAEANNLTINNLDLVKHMNADQATCGYGC